MKLTSEQIGRFDRDGYLFFPEPVHAAGDESAFSTRCRRCMRSAGPENVREKGSDAVRTNFAAHMYSYPFAKLARHPRMVEPVMAAFRRSGVHAPVQDQRQDGFRRRRLAMAPGLRHLEERRPDAGAARDERGDLPGRGERVQRPADVHPGQPQTRRARRGSTILRPPAILCGPSTTTPSASWWNAAASSRRRARPDR